MEKTRRGIYLNIEESDYKLNYAGYCFTFSSEFYRDRFMEKVKQYEEKISAYLLNKTHVVINSEQASALLCYSDVEKRGFLVECAGKRYRALYEFSGKLIII